MAINKGNIKILGWWDGLPIWRHKTAQDHIEEQQIRDLEKIKAKEFMAKKIDLAEDDEALKHNSKLPDGVEPNTPF